MWTHVVQDQAERQARTVVDPVLDWLQPFIEDPLTRLLLSGALCRKSAAQSPVLVAVVQPPAQDRWTGPAEAKAPCSACFIKSRSGITKFRHRKSLTRSQLLTPATVQRDCGNSGVVTEKLLDCRQTEPKTPATPNRAVFLRLSSVSALAPLFARSLESLSAALNPYRPLSSIDGNGG